jgi:hypothetical protein
MYSTTSKVLDKRLSKEEQLVYMKCFVPKSFADLDRTTGLGPDLLERALKNLVSAGYLRELSNTVPSTFNPKVTLTPEHSQENPLDRAKRKLQEDLGRTLGSQADTFNKEMQAAPSVAELRGVSRKILLKLKLTVSQRAAREFEASIQSNLGDTP